MRKLQKPLFLAPIGKGEDKDEDEEEEDEVRELS